jgi:pimeloyl-ACP methyl ester carboxylesterase
MPTAQINGVDLFYEIDGDGPVLAFIHGGFGGEGSSMLPRQRDWQKVLAKGYSVITYDRRSAGQSAYPEDGYTLPTFASDLRELLRKVGIQRAVIMGDSAGGPIALTYALTYADTVDALILVETASRLMNDRAREGMRRQVEVLEQEGPAAAFDYIQKEQAEESGQTLASRMSVPPDRMEQFQKRQRQVEELAAQLTREERVRYNAGEVRNRSAYLDSDLTGRLKEINVPTLVVHGDADQVVPISSGKALAGGIPGAQLSTIAGAGHGLTQWPETIAVIKEFLDRVSAPTVGELRAT